MSPRVYTRKFDWDEAKRLREAGDTWASIARRFDVTVSAVRAAVDPDVRLGVIAARSRYQTSGICERCGGPRSRNDSMGIRFCASCARDLSATSVREDELWCWSCREWKPDDDFPWVSENARGSIRRRGRRGHCRACDTQQRAARRLRARQREA